MKQRGRPRKLTTSPVLIEGSFGQRPEPPSALSLLARDIWRETVASEPAEFFATAALRGLLADYCRHRESLERLAVILDAVEVTQEKLGAYGALLRLRDLEARAAAALATKLRLTNQARYVSPAATTAARAVVAGRKPWDA